MSRSTIDRLFAYIIPRKGRIILFFKLLYFAQIAVLFLASVTFYSSHTYTILYYQLGLYFGKIAVILFILALIPGMLKRFGITHKILALLMIFRRYIGISMFLFALSHYFLVKIFPNLSSLRTLTFSTFELWGSGALFILFFLFITSNDFSVRKMGIWWYRMQRLIYIAVWLIFFHVALQRISLWTILLGVTVFLMMASFVFEKIRKNSKNN